jgi:tetratricopeptide (TPR) repeat protein
MLAAEARGRSAEIAKLESEVAAIRGHLDRLSVQTGRLTETALWDSQPTGGLAANEYVRIARVFSDWADDGVDLASSLALHAFALANAGALDEAEERARRAYALNRTSPLCLAARAHVDCRKGDTRSAASTLKRAIHLASQSGILYLLRGLAYQGSGNHEAAQTDYRKSVQLAPEQPLAHCYLAVHLAAAPLDHLRDAKSAVEHAEAAERLAGCRHWMACEALAAAQAEVGRFNDAIAAQRQAVELAPLEYRPTRQHRLALFESGFPLRLE